MKNNLLVLTREPEWNEFEFTLKSLNLPELEIVVARSEGEMEENILNVI